MKEQTGSSQAAVPYTPPLQTQTEIQSAVPGNFTLFKPNKEIAEENASLLENDLPQIVKPQKANFDVALTFLPPTGSDLEPYPVRLMFRRDVRENYKLKDDSAWRQVLSELPRPYENGSVNFQVSRLAVDELNIEGQYKVTKINPRNVTFKDFQWILAHILESNDFERPLDAFNEYGIDPNDL